MSINSLLNYLSWLISDLQIFIIIINDSLTHFVYVYIVVIIIIIIFTYSHFIQMPGDDGNKVIEGDFTKINAENCPDSLHY